MGRADYGRYALLTSLADWFVLAAGLGFVQVFAQRAPRLLAAGQAGVVRKLFGRLLACASRKPHPGTSEWKDRSKRGCHVPGGPWFEWGTPLGVEPGIVWLPARRAAVQIGRRQSRWPATALAHR
jgi:hypothetical protein